MSEQKPIAPPAVNLQSLLKAIEKAPNLSTIKRTLSKYIQDVFQVEMATIFLLHARKQELVSWILIPGGDALKQITVPLGTSSIVGYVATKKQAINLQDPYDVRELSRVDSALNFFDTYDEQAKVRSKQILAVPIVYDTTMMGVVELINKKDDTAFTQEDQKKGDELAAALAAAFSSHGTFGKQTHPQYEPLLAQQLLSRKELVQGLAKASELGEDPEAVLMKTFKIPKLEMGKLLAKYYSSSFADLASFDKNPAQLFKGINIDYFEEEELVPLSLVAGKLMVATRKVDDQSLSGAIRKQVPKVNQVELVFAFKEDIHAFWKRTRAKYSRSSKTVRAPHNSTADAGLFDLLENDHFPVKEAKRISVVERIVSPQKHAEENTDISDPAVVRMVNEIIENGYLKRASDIHIEPYGSEEECRVRYRIKGVCSSISKIPHRYMAQLVDRIKFLASLKRGEHNRPQVGKIDFTTSEGKKIGLRVATIPTVDSNEDIVLHILPAPKPLPSLSELIPLPLLDPFKERIEKKHGIILVVGPSVSGKTTTLHSALAHINTAEKKIWTAENPVEIRQQGIRQVQIAPLQNYNYTDALQAFLNADPDVILLGEMQGLQTAMLAVEAAQNGKLLLSSVSVNSAAEAITHCLHMGMDPFHLAEVLRCVLAQRLVHILCDHCKEAYQPEQAEYDLLIESYGVSFFEHINVMYGDNLVFYRTKGCSSCHGTGYRGQKAVFELLVVNASMKKLIMNRAPLGQIIEEAVLNDTILLSQTAIKLVFEGAIDTNELTLVNSL